jgi:short subunit dehydrogenase-like uncharacterized protein
VGRLVTFEAVTRGLRPLLLGRDPERLAKLGNDLGLPYRVCTVDDRESLDEVLGDRDVLLNCAGPFRSTAPPLVSACLRSRTHYLDTTGELSVIHWIVSLDDEAQRRGVMLLPGVGFDLVPSDYLARYLKTRLSSAVELRLFRTGFEALSQGSAKTLVEALREPAYVRRNDKLVRVPIGWKRRVVDWGEGARDAVIIPWVDVLTAYRTTHVPNIEVYALTDSRIVRTIRRLRFLKPVLGIKAVRRAFSRYLANIGVAPDRVHDGSGQSLIYGEVSGCDGAVAAAILRGPDAYTVTVLAAATALQHVSTGTVKPGFQTAAKLLGGALIQEMDCFYVEDVD